MPVRNETKFMLSKPEIIKFFDKAGNKVFSVEALDTIFQQHREKWRLGKTWSTYAFIQSLLSKTKLKKFEIKFPARTHTRYTWGNFSIFPLIGSIDQRAYFSHYSALYLNELTEQIPKSIFLNIEQQSYGQKSELSQKRVDWAFKLNPRMSNNIAEIDNFKVHLLAGKNTSNLGVELLDSSDIQGKIKITNIERTLIDITVRPFYAGGIGQVLNAFKTAAQKRVSINKLCQYLGKLDYTYPYHQAIGFYMERSEAYTPAQLDMIDKKFEKPLKFYLTYKMTAMDYSNRWKLFYPKGF